jgi:hypothetical protein
MKKKRPPLTDAQRIAKQARDRAYRARKKAEAIASGRPLEDAYGHQRRRQERQKRSARRPAPFVRDLSNDPVGIQAGAIALYTSRDKARLTRALRQAPAGAVAQVNVTFLAQRTDGRQLTPRPMSRALYGQRSRAMYPIEVVGDPPAPIGKVTIALFGPGREGIPVADLLAGDLWQTIAEQYERSAE